MRPKKIAAVFMRGGTSKGLFFHEKDLPPPGPERDRLLLAALGSPDPYGRQLNGLGGGVSSLSKVIIVRPAADPDADVEYLHGQVAVDAALVDYSANCGNLSGAVGPFAINEGLVPAQSGETLVRLRNLNTGDLIHARAPTGQGGYPNAGDFAFPGVGGRNARIELDYIAPGGGLMLPTGLVRQSLDGVEATLSLSPLPTVWLRGADVGAEATAAPDRIDGDAPLMARLDHLRRAGAVAMGLAESPEQANRASPKIGILGPPADYVALDGSTIAAGDVDVVARVLSMERTHKALPLACAMNLAAAIHAEGTAPNAIARAPGAKARLGTPSGVLEVGAQLDRGEDGLPRIAKVRVETTARRLMDGHVYCD